ncbi:spore germination protein [Bacillus sp. BP-3]|uniref:spore germination protein n=1 Tax=Bacillus sp. BP-3 TaxID=3022773 RepID=UPI00232FF645|nr:spore germination protein [Bacillus sp. BP-3]MDC2867871.1 spore germination protein [Bacillus sp. BP-3]
MKRMLWRRSYNEPDCKKQTEREELFNNDKDSSLSSDLSENLQQIKKILGDSSDVIIRDFEINRGQIKVAVVYLDSLVDKRAATDFINHSLMTEGNQGIVNKEDVFSFIKNNALTVQKLKVISHWNDLIFSLLSGDTVILINGWTEVISGQTGGREMRAITESTTQVSIRGPKDSFNESIWTNISLIRSRIASSNLWLETMRIGQETQTNVAIMYIKKTVNDQLLQEVKRRLNEINTDRILDSGYIEHLIEDHTFSPFPTVYNTERPDGAAGNLLEGRIAILVDGSPFVLIVPTLFVQFFQAPDDYIYRYDISSFLRILRYISFVISLLAPSVYIAAITFHQEMIPSTLLISIAASREGVPLPAFVEAFLMEATFELLREAGIRMPRAVGQAVSIVGALVLGQAAVQAGLVSPQMVIVVAITGIASFSIPSYDLAASARLIRFLLMALAATFGFYGLVLGTIIIIAHLNSLKSFGIPYLTPFSPFVLNGQKDAMFRFPLKFLLTQRHSKSVKNMTSELIEKENKE